MKIILLQDVAKIGKRFEVVNVPDGYAMNQLIPKRMAEAATAANVKRVEKMHSDKAASVEADSEAFASAVDKLRATTAQIEVDANDQGHLFKAVSAADVVKAAKAVGATIEAAMVIFAEPIKEIGDHEVRLKQSDNEAVITISVISVGK